MKRNLNIVNVLAVVLILLIPQETDAQILKGLGKKIEKKVEQQVNRRVDRRVDNAINKGMDKAEDAAAGAIEGSNSKSEKSDEVNGTRSTIGNLGVLMDNSNVSPAGSYDFTLGVTYDIRNGNDKPMETTMWFGGEEYIGMSTSMENNMFMIMHNENMIAFMEKEKNYMVIGGGMIGDIVNAAAEESSDDYEAENFSIEKIGTERILNYNCDVYELKSSEYTNKIWLTQDLNTEAGNFMKAFSALVKSDNVKKLPNMQNDAGGILLKMEGMSIKDNEVMIMEATAINKQGLQFNTSEYTRFGL